MQQESLYTSQIPRHLADGNKIFGMEFSEIAILLVVGLGGNSVLKMLRPVGFDLLVPFPVLGTIYLSSVAIWILMPSGFAILALYKRLLPDYNLQSHVVYLLQPKFWSASARDATFVSYASPRIHRKDLTAPLRRLRVPYHKAQSHYESDEQRRSLAGQLPWVDIVNGVVPMVNGLVAVGLRLTPLNSDALMPADYNRIFAGLRAFLFSHDGTRYYQFHHRRRRATARDVERLVGPLGTTGNPELDAFARFRREHLLAQVTRGELFESEHYLWVTFTPTRAWKASTTSAIGEFFAKALSNTGTYIKKRNLEAHHRMLEDVGKQAASIVQLLTLAGVRAEPLTDEEILHQLRSSLTPSADIDDPGPLDARYRTAPDCPELYEHLPEARPFTVREQIAGSDIWFEGDSLRLDGRPTRVFHLRGLPHRAVPGIIERLTNLPFPVWIVENLKLEPHLKAIGEAKTMLTLVESLATASWGGMKPKTPEAEVAAEELSATLKQQVRQEDLTLYLNLLIRLQADTLDELELWTSRLRSAVKRLNYADLGYDRHAQQRLLLASCPGNGQADIRYKWTNVDAAATLAPVVKKWRGTPPRVADEGLPEDDLSRSVSTAPVLAYPNRRGELFVFDPARITLSNWLIFGKSGSGKSMFVFMLLLEFLMQPSSELFVLDCTGSDGKNVGGQGLGGSASAYPRLCSVAGGQYIDVNLTTLPNFQPFAVRVPASDLDQDVVYLDGNIDPTLFEGALAVIESLALNRGELELKKDYSGVLHDVFMRMIYGFRDPARPPVMEDFLQELEAEATRDERAMYLRRCLARVKEDTPLGQYLNRRDRFDPTSRLTVFDLANLHKFGAFGPTIVLIIMNFIYRKMLNPARRGIRKGVIVDEAFKLLNGPLAEYLSSLNALVRKHKGWIAYLTQDINDITDVPAGYGKRILANTSIHVVLKTTRLKQLSEELDLTDADAALIKGLAQMAYESNKTATREAFVKVGEQRTVLRLTYDPRLHYLAAADPEENELLEIMQLLWGVPGRDLSYAEFMTQMATYYPPGWVDGKNLSAVKDQVLAALPSPQVVA